MTRRTTEEPHPDRVLATDVLYRPSLVWEFAGRVVVGVYLCGKYLDRFLVTQNNPLAMMFPKKRGQHPGKGSVVV